MRSYKTFFDLHKKTKKADVTAVCITNINISLTNI